MKMQGSCQKGRIREINVVVGPGDRGRKERQSVLSSLLPLKGGTLSGSSYIIP